MKHIVCVLLLFVFTSAASRADTISLSADRDTYLMGAGSSGITGVNYGVSDVMVVGQAAPWWESACSLLSFDASAIPACTVNAITLRLHVDSYFDDGAGPYTVNTNVYALLASNKDWVEGTGGVDGATLSGSCADLADSNGTADVAWAGGGLFGSSDCSATVLSTLALDASDADTYVDFTFSGTSTELTSLIDGWRTDNAGLLVWAPPTGGGIYGIRFDSSENGTAAYTPELIVDMTPVPEPSSLVLLAGGLTGLLANVLRKRR